MRRITIAVLISAAFLVGVFAQDWYHEREERFRGEEWRRHVFDQVRTDPDHVWSATHASDKERKRLDRTKEELTKMQGDLNQGRFDNGILNDVIDSLRKSSNDKRLAPRDRDVIADDVNRLKDYQDHHNQWPH